MADNLDDWMMPDTAPEPPQEQPKPAPRSQQKQDRTQSQAIPDLTLDSGLPANIDAEKTILGAILLDNAAFLEAAEKIEADDFSLDSHRRIFARMAELIDDNRAIDIVTLAEQLNLHKEVSAVGGVAYLASLTEGLPRRPAIAEYLLIVKDKSIARKIMGLSSVTIAKLADQAEPALATAVWHESELESIVAGGIKQGLRDVSEISLQVWDKYAEQAKLDQSPGFSYGVPEIDEATGGIQEEEQVVIGCYSGVGKSTILAQIVAANCAKGVRAAMFLIEPTRHQFLRRLWSIVGNVRYTAVTKPWLATKEERERLHWAMMQVGEWGLWIVDNSNLTLDEQLAYQRVAMHRHGVELCGIDYIQRLKVKAENSKEDIRLKIGRASTMNADLIKGTKCRNVLLSQFNRGGGMNTLPTMDKLRESGQLENDAHQIILFHLNYDEENGHFTDEGVAIIPKQRFGVPTNVKVWKDQKTALWRSGDKEDVTTQQAQLYGGGAQLDDNYDATQGEIEYGT